MDAEARTETTSHVSLARMPWVTPWWNLWKNLDWEGMFQRGTWFFVRDLVEPRPQRE